MPDVQDPSQDPSSQLAQLVGLISQARSTPVPTQPSLLPLMLDPGAPSSQPPKTIADFMSTGEAETSKPVDRSSAEVMTGGAPQSKVLQKPQAPDLPVDPYAKFNYDFTHKIVPQVDPRTGHVVRDDQGQPVMVPSEWYTSPARRALQSFLTGVASGGMSLLTGHFDPMRELKREQFQTDQQIQNQNYGRQLQFQKESALEQSRADRLNFQREKLADTNTLSQESYKLKYGHYAWQEKNADAKLALAGKAEQDRVAGRNQTLALSAQGPALRNATSYVQQQHIAAGDNLNDPKIQDQMKVEIADRLDEEQPKVHADLVWSKLGETGLLDKVDWNKPEQIQAAINNSNLDAKDKAFMKGYVVTHPTPASTAAARIAGAQAYGNIREYPAINTNTGQLGFANPTQINAPGAALAPAGPAGAAMSKEAIIAELHRATNQSVEAWKGLKEPLSTPARILMMRIKASGDQGIVAGLLTKEALGDLSPEEQNLVMTTGTLKENALAMRSAGGFGQGSESTRNAVDAVLPSGATPDPKYALKQLDLLTNQINTLESGIPGVGQVTERQRAIGAGNPGAGNQRREQQNGKGAYRFTTDGGKTWQPGRLPRQ